MVLCGSERMGHALQAVYYGTGKVVGRVDAGKRRRRKKENPAEIRSSPCFHPNNSRTHLPVGVASARVGGVLAAEQGGVPHAAVVGLHVDLGPHAAGLTAL